MDPLQWMGAVSKESKRPSPSVNVLWSQKLIYCNRHLKQIHHGFNLNNIAVHNIAFSKVIGSESGEKSAQIKHHL